MTRRMRRAAAAVLGLALMFASAERVAADPAEGSAPQSAPAAEARIAVLYPNIGEPYRTVFEQIIAGIENRTKAPVVRFALPLDAGVGELNSNLRRQNIKVVIALGHQGMKVAATLSRGIDIVVGGVVAPPENELSNAPVISLSPDPALLFSHLKELMPAARRVLVVYDPHQNAWLIRLAREAARAHGLELVASEAPDLRTAARTYENIFASADARRDAVWLLQDSISAESGTILPLVLQESWNHSLAVFSSNFGHVKRGALFSLYPDNVEMGRHLADSAQEFLASGEHEERGMILLREVLVAINLRTAAHLGLKPGKKQSFGMVFPEP